DHLQGDRIEPYGRIDVDAAAIESRLDGPRAQPAVLESGLDVHGTERAAGDLSGRQMDRRLAAQSRQGLRVPKRTFELERLAPPAHEAHALAEVRPELRLDTSQLVAQL